MIVKKKRKAEKVFRVFLSFKNKISFFCFRLFVLFCLKGQSLFLIYLFFKNRSRWIGWGTNFQLGPLDRVDNGGCSVEKRRLGGSFYVQCRERNVQMGHVLLGILFYLFIMWMPMLLLGPTTKNQNESNMGWPSSNLKSRLLGITGSLLSFEPRFHFYRNNPMRYAQARIIACLVWTTFLYLTQFEITRKIQDGFGPL